MHRYKFPSLLSVACIILLAASFTFAQGGVKGRVRAKSGEGISGASVTARQNGKDVKSARSDTNGTFRLDGLQSGVYSIFFDADGFASGLLQGVEVKGSDIRDLGDRLILGPDNGLLVILNGSVFYKEGMSVGGAKVTIERIEADGSAKKIASVYTTPRGEFTYKMPQGEAKLRITAKYKGASGSKEVEVGTAAIYRLAITLDLAKKEN